MPLLASDQSPQRIRAKDARQLVGAAFLQPALGQLLAVGLRLEQGVQQLEQLALASAVLADHHIQAGSEHVVATGQRAEVPDLGLLEHGRDPQISSAPWLPIFLAGNSWTILSVRTGIPEYKSPPQT